MLYLIMVAKCSQLALARSYLMTLPTMCSALLLTRSGDSGTQSWSYLLYVAEARAPVIFFTFSFRTAYFTGKRLTAENTSGEKSVLL